MLVGNSLGKTTGGVSVQPPTKVTAFDDVYAMAEMARKLAYRVQELEVRLLGPVPCEASTSGDTFDGILPRLGSDARLTAGLLQEAFDSLSRIEAALP